MKFQFDQLLLQPQDPLKEYIEDEQGTNNVHWGQRKLLLSEILFLTRFWNPQEIPEPIIVYAGAAPANHIPLLSQLFPECLFHLYDPQPFHIKNTEKIHLHQKLFTTQEVCQWANRNNIFFISDIRTANAQKQQLQPHEETIIKDMKLQASWYLKMKPVSALLKFRLPYPVGLLPRTFRYLDGWIFKQPWAPPRSTETRLVPNGGIRIWEIKKYESQMFYHNTEIRSTQKYDHPHCPPELLDDFDSVGEMSILADYFRQRKEEPTHEKVVNLSSLITLKLNDGKIEDNYYTLQKLRNDPNLIRHKYLNDT